MARNILSISVVIVSLFVLVGVPGVHSQTKVGCLAGEEMISVPYNGHCETGDCATKLNKLVVPGSTRLTRSMCDPLISCQGCYMRITPSPPPPSNECYPGDEVIKLPYAGSCLECEQKLRKKATKDYTLWRWMCAAYTSCEGCYTRNPPPPPPSPPRPPPSSPSPPQPSPTPPPPPPYPSPDWESSVFPEEMILRNPSTPDKKWCRYKLAEF
ncbi:hypothetical protein C5167_031869 [Papaver somniferum]|uniref:Uncharacterized protein n=1 Tax=Papaver somniferum TaxID=3469 RepID=A0A4Y7K726_PAPSO|nr:chitin-binding lectin 1-like [Papaver somniferum]RZC68717.1 hypothetical protein C5167_031869 [Papaver somniferum]